jgi:hypothetical protein
MAVQIYTAVLLHPEGLHDGAIFEVAGHARLISNVGDDVEPIAREEAADTVATGRDLYVLTGQTEPARLVYVYVTLHDLMQVA